VSPPPTGPEAPPPIGGTWRRLYAAVILFLVLQIAVYWIFTRAFR
jgi:hypothetical protein